MPGEAIVGGIIGLVVAWLITALKSKATHLGGGWFEMSGMGCFASVLLYLFLGGLGFGVGIVVANLR